MRLPGVKWKLYELDSLQDVIKVPREDQLGTKTVVQNPKGMESKTEQFEAIKDWSGQAANLPYHFIYQVFSFFFKKRARKATRIAPFIGQL
jgi:hypothetical protein